MHGEDLSRSRPARLIGPLRVCFESNEPAVAARLEALYAGFLLEAEGAAAVSAPLLVVRIDGDSGEWVGKVGDAVVRCSADLALVEESITRHVNRQVLDAEDDRLHIHAGSVTRNGRTVLIVGESGAGKSTLVAKLVSLGWHYLSDEQLGVLPGGQLVRNPRPITLRRNSWPLFPHVIPDGISSAVDRIEVAPSELGSVHMGGPLVPDLIVCPDVSVPEATCTRRTAAATLAALFADTLDLERSGQLGFASLIELALAAPCVQIAGTDLDATYATITSQLDAAVRPVSLSAHLAADNATATGAWLFDDGNAVLYHHESGVLAQLDHSGYQAWEEVIVAGEHLTDEMRASDFVSDLVQHGLLQFEDVE